MNDAPIAYSFDGKPIYDNTPTVVAVVIENGGEVIAIRRNTNPEKGKLALPGGFHMRGETWQQAGAREVWEEIGLVINPNRLRLMFMETDSYGHNVVLAKYTWPQDNINPDSAITLNIEEASEYIWINRNNLKAEKWSFPLHYRAALMSIYTEECYD